MSNSEKSSTDSQALRFLGLIAGIAVGTYSGINLLLPLFATGVVWWSGTRLLKERFKIILPALSVNAGHFFWLLFGLFLAGTGALGVLGVDIAMYSIGLIWLVSKPGVGPIYLLSIFQFLSLAVNSYALIEATVGSAPHKALVVHVIWRCLALFYLFKLYRKMQRTDVAAAP